MLAAPMPGRSGKRAAKIVRYPCRKRFQQGRQKKAGTSIDLRTATARHNLPHAWRRPKWLGLCAPIRRRLLSVS